MAPSCFYSLPLTQFPSALESPKHAQRAKVDMVFTLRSGNSKVGIFSVICELDSHATGKFYAGRVSNYACAINS